jgi:hypothetical protein
MASDPEIVYAGDDPMTVALPKVRDGTSTDEVDDGWTCNIFNVGAGPLTLIDNYGRRVKIVAPYSQCALVATDLGEDGTYGGWVEAFNWPNQMVRESTRQYITVTSAASDATPSVAKGVNRILLSASVAITYLDDGVLGQRVAIEIDGGTNTTEANFTNAGSFLLHDARDLKLSTNDLLFMEMVSTQGWAEVGRNVSASSQQYRQITCSESSEVDADSYDYFNVSCTASAIGTSGIPGGTVGQIITFYTSKTGPSMHHSSAANYLHLEDLNIVLSTEAVAADHGGSYVCVANAWMMFQKDPASRWVPINDGGWPSSV